MLIDTDSLKFEFVENFLQLPSNIKLGHTHGVCVDAYGDVYVVEWISTGRITS